MKRITTFLLSILVGLSAYTLPGRGQALQGPPMPPGQGRGAGVIVGQVVDGHGQPITDALVTAAGRGGAADRVVVDPRGRFVFRNLPAGALGVVATRPGYVGGAVDQREPAEPGRPIELADGQQLTNITLRMWKGGAIDGTVFGDANEPLTGVEIHALRRSLLGGRWMIAAGPTTTTDDVGRYRFDSLAPGDYFIVARPDRDPETALLLAMLSANPAQAVDVMAAAASSAHTRPEPDERVRNYPLTFYPASASMSGATPITIAMESERSKIDLRLKLSKVVRVSGTLSNRADGVLLQLVPLDPNDAPIPIDAAVTACDEEGSFEFTGVTPGRYLVRVQSAPEPAVNPPPQPPPNQGGPGGPGGPGGLGGPPPGQPLSSAPAFSGSVAITVGTTDVTNVAVPVRKGVVVSGRLAFNGMAARPAPAQLTQIALRLDPIDQPAPGAAPAGAIWRGQVDADGKFRTSSLPPGEYFLRVGAPPRGWTPLSALSGGHDILDAPLVVGATDIDDVTIAFADGPQAAIAGVVHDGKDATAQDAAVVIFPTDRLLWRDSTPQSRRLRLARPSSAGRFGVSNLPPGEYFVAAVAESFSNEWQDPERLGALASIATRVAVQAGPAQPIQLDATPGLKTRPSTSAATTTSSTRSPAPSNAKSSTPARPSSSRGAKTGTIAGSISGTIIDRVTRRPVLNATVVVAGTDVGLLRVTSTDARGQFVVDALPAGRFLIGAGKPAHLPAMHGANRPGRPGSVLAITAGQHVANLTLPLTRGAVIAGTVTGDDDRPLPGARVRVVQHRAAGGEVAMNGDAGDPVVVTTDDRGAYRVFNLPPGEYAVLVQTRGLVGGDVRRLTASDVEAASSSPIAPAPANGMAIGWAAAYAPATSTPADAKAVTVAPGEIRADVNVRTALARLVRVEGVISNGDRGNPQATQISIRPRGLAASGAILTNLTTRPGPDGRFMFPNVPPGDYTILARTQPPPPVQDQQIPGQPPGAPNASLVRWAMTDVSVREENVANIALEMRPALRVSGELRIAGLNRLPQDLPLIRVGVRPTPGSAVQNAPPPVLADRDGRFTIEGLVPGRYRVFLQVPNNDVLQVPAWFAKTATIDAGNGADAFDAPFDVGPSDVERVIVTLTDTTQEIDGVVRDASGATVRDCTVLVFSTDRASWFQQSRRVGTRQTGRDGRFVFGIAATLPAGDYFVAAVPDGRPGEQLDVLLLDELAKTATRVTLSADETKTVEIRVRRPDL